MLGDQLNSCFKQSMWIPIAGRDVESMKFPHTNRRVDVKTLSDEKSSC